MTLDSKPILRMFVVDIPYNLKVREDETYHMPFKTCKASFSFQRITTEKYSETKPLDEGGIQYSKTPAAWIGSGEGQTRITLENIDPKRKGFEYKYMRARIFILDLEKDFDYLGDLIDAINKFIDNYRSFSGDTIPDEINASDLRIGVELNKRPGTTAIDWTTIITEFKNTDTAMRLTEKGSQRFQEYLEDERTKSTKFIQRANHLIHNDYPSAAILYAEKSVERTIESLIDLKSEGREKEILSYLGMEDTRSLKGEIKKLGYLVNKRLKELDEYIRYNTLRSNHRNQLVHSDHEVGREEAREYLEAVRKLKICLEVNVLEDEKQIDKSLKPEYEFYNGKKVDRDGFDYSEYEESFSKVEPIWEEDKE